MVGAFYMASAFAVEIVEAKYPQEFIDPRCSKDVFEIIELVCYDLVSRNGAIFITPFIDKLVDVKDVAYGDKVDFIVPLNTM